MIPRATVSSDRIWAVLQTPSSVLPPEQPVAPETSTGVVEFRDATFAYPGADRPVLRHLSFLAPPGQTTAIIGSSGAGKSTALSLIPRLYDVTDGAVLIDGVDVRELAPEELWARLGLVPGRPYLFSGTVASNLRFGNPDATEADLWAALEIAQARDFVSEMPEQLDAPISQGGTNVSGGQRQRLCIARALVAQPQVYLFDDSFSALDLSTDARLRAALAPHTREAVVVIVAQRVSTIIDAEQIIVLEDGEIVGKGNYDELMIDCPTFVEIVESQRGVEEAA
ncbi:MAG: ABC transporter ATP-binding protein, partial [Sciscionella sp.]